MRKYLIIGLICVLLVCLCGAVIPAYATAEDIIQTSDLTGTESALFVTGADILRGARSNVNRESLMLNPTEDGLVISGTFEKDKSLVKAAIKKGVLFTEDFSLNSEILKADGGCITDIGLLYGEIDEAWLDPWDFLGIDMNDPGSLAKFQNIGGMTLRFSMRGESVSYEKVPLKKIEFSVIENYYVGSDEYVDRNFTYLSQPYQNPSYRMTQNGLRLSGWENYTESMPILLI